MKKKTLRWAVAALALAMLLGWVYWRFAPRVVSGDKHISITVTHENGASDVYEVDTDAAYLKEAAESVLTLTGETGSYGFTLYAINGEEADFRTGSAYWAIYVNEAYGQYAVDKQPVTDGDQFRFAYELS